MIVQLLVSISVGLLWTFAHTRLVLIGLLFLFLSFSSPTWQVVLVHNGYLLRLSYQSSTGIRWRMLSLCYIWGWNKGRGCYIPQPHQTLQACHFVIRMFHVLMFCTQQNLHVLQAILKIQTHKWKSLEDVITTTNLLSFPVLVTKVLLLNLLLKPCLWTTHESHNFFSNNPGKFNVMWGV